MHRRRGIRVRLWIGGAAVLAAVATGGVAVFGLSGSEPSGDANAAIRAAETLAPPSDEPTPDATPTPSVSPSPESPGPGTAGPRPRLAGGPPRAATGESPGPEATTAKPRARRTTKAPAASTGSPELAVLARINAARAAAGAGPLTMSAPLVAAAHAHNLRMADGCGLSHQCGGEPGIGDRISAQGVQWSSVAENVGTGGPVDDNDSGQTDMAVGLTDSMLAEVPPDDGHRKNILNPSLGRIGIDVIRDGNGTVWLTHDFAN